MDANDATSNRAEIALLISQPHIILPGSSLGILNISPACIRAGMRQEQY